MLGYLPPVLPNQRDSGDRGHGKKTHLGHQLDYTCRIVDTAFAPEVDVTGAANGRGLRRVGRFHRRELQSPSSVADDAEMTWAFRSLLD